LQDGDIIIPFLNDFWNVYVPVHKKCTTMIMMMINAPLWVISSELRNRD